MNTKKVHKHKIAKSGIKTKTKNGDAEIFVLPPDILQKLGINLGCLENAQECTSIQKQNIDQAFNPCNSLNVANTKTNDSNTSFEKETSMLETAHLMKKSVFLSPTFIPTNCGEFEIANVVTGSDISEINLSSQDIEPILYSSSSSSIKINNNIPATYKFCENFETGFGNNITTTEEEKVFCNTKSCHNYNQVVANKNVPGNACDIPSVNLSKIQDRPQPEIIRDIKNKVNIISEEVFDTKRLKNIKNLCPPATNDLIPVTINTIISSNKNTSINLTNQEIFNNIEQAHMITKNTEKSGTYCDSNLTGVIQTIDGETITIDNNQILPEELGIIIDEKKIDDGLRSHYSPSEDFTLSDIEKHLEDNERILEIITNDTTSGSRTTMEQKCNESSISEIVKHLEENESVLEVNEKDISSLYDNVEVEETSDIKFNDSNLKECKMVTNFITNSDLFDKPVVKFCREEHNQLESITQRLSICNDSFLIEKAGDCSSIENSSCNTEDITVQVNSCDSINKENKIGINCEINEKDIKAHTSKKSKEKLCSLFYNNMKRNNILLNGSEDEKFESFITNEIKDTDKTNKISLEQGIHTAKLMTSVLMHNKVKSKLCVQGVEKPGGVLKTYERKSKLSLITKDHLKHNPSLQTCDNASNKINLIDEITLCQKQQFCLCNDFGRLSFYDCNSYYEHIHFCQETSAICDSLTLFSIYNEDNDDLQSMSNTDWNSEQTNGQQQLTQNSQHNICWSDYSTMNTTDISTNIEVPFIDNSKTKDVKNDTEISSAVSTKLITEKLKDNEQFHFESTSVISPDTVTDIATDFTESVVQCCKETESSKLDVCNKNTTEHDKSGIEEYVDEKKISPKIKKIVKKRKISSSLVVENKTDEEPQVKKSVKCGVCYQFLAAFEWKNHVAVNHCFIAWKDGKDFEFKDDKLYTKLNQKLVTDGKLKCTFCGLNKRKCQQFLVHVQKCYTKHMELALSRTIKTRNTEREISKASFQVKCAVCSQDVLESNWMEHIATQHNYLAWKDGDVAIDLNCEETIRQHLHSVSKKTGGLVCPKCGLIRKYVKHYLSHIKTCDGNEESQNTSRLDNSLNDSSIEKVSDVIVKCGVCGEEMKDEKWMEHIKESHSYIAWRDGEQPIDLNDVQEIVYHLDAISKKMDGLVCSKCNLKRKYAKSFYNHTLNCDLNTSKNNLLGSDTVVCGICSETINSEDWETHAMTKHYNITWIVGEEPIDFKSAASIEKYLKEYKKKYKTLECKICGAVRVSFMGFFAHVIACEKTEEEMDIYKTLCDICNSKYLSIYRSQHTKMHLQKEYAKEWKLKSEMIKKQKVEEVEPLESGRRRAAEKARTVIQEYKNEIDENENENVCSICGFQGDSDTELPNHECIKVEDEDDFDVGDKIENESDTSESDADSKVSEEENEIEDKKKTSDSAIKMPRIPFGIKNPKNYMIETGKEFCKFHYTKDRLYPDWGVSEHQPLTAEEQPNYLPPLEESCKVKLENKWTTITRFGHIEERVSSIFVGACIQCISWVPPNIKFNDQNFLAVVCHQGTDCPRLEPDQLTQSPGHIQIWDFGDFTTSTPTFVLGLAHDYGTVWSMEWCPSGTQDPEGSNDHQRLGLMAIACSNGFCYIFSIPHPTTVNTNDCIFHKFKPVAELRIASSKERKMFQATAISWSKQKGHAVIMVGYGDGTTAYYDLQTDSSLLKAVENDVTIFYPYMEERSHNACVTGVALYPGVSAEKGAASSCSTSVTGASLVSLGAVMPRHNSHQAAANATFTAHWPSALIGGDEAALTVIPNEMEFWGGGRRVGGINRCSNCLHCGRLVVYSTPLLRTVLQHPAYVDVKKRAVALLKMTTLGAKRKSKQLTDELVTKIEPSTYEDAIKKYGIHFELLKDAKTARQLAGMKPECYPDRFPLSEVTSMALCPSKPHHDKLVLATHGGVIFIVNL